MDRQTADIYRLPPMQIRPIDEWREEEAGYGHDNGDGLEHPAPDYSDSENEEDDNNNAIAVFGKEDDLSEDEESLKSSIKGKLATLLTPDEWEKIVTSAETVGADLNIPEPDYQEEAAPNGSADQVRPLGRSYSVPPSASLGSVQPKKLSNPVLDSKERQNLHRELLMNQRMGVDVLHQKSELEKELERRKSQLKKKEMEEHQISKQTSFEKKLAEQALKLKLVDQRQRETVKEEKETPEFLQVHSRIYRAKSDS